MSVERAAPCLECAAAETSAGVAAHKSCIAYNSYYPQSNDDVAVDIAALELVSRCSMNVKIPSTTLNELSQHTINCISINFGFSVF